MNRTANYSLPQWDESDRILRTDFNSAMSAIDASIHTAESKADSAQSTATAAQNKKNYVTGSYTGSGQTRTIVLGFRPSFLIISGMKPASGGSDIVQFTTYFGATGGRAISERIEFTANGFIAHAQGSGHSYHPDFSESGRNYDYIAFR